MNKQYTTLQFLDSLCSAFDSILVPDFYTHTHQILTAHFVKSLGAHLGLNIEGNNLLWMGARLHDIGKIGVLLELHQNRFTKLERTSPEFEIIKQHTIIGERFFNAITDGLCENEFTKQLAIIARSHHEHWDGNGYPDHLRHYMIPYYARIVGVVDALSAMIGPDRPYRASKPFVEALQELERCAGSQFDPHIVAAVIEVFEKHDHFLQVTS